MKSSSAVDSVGMLQQDGVTTAQATKHQRLIANSRVVEHSMGRWRGSRQEQYSKYSKLVRDISGQAGTGAVI